MAKVTYKGSRLTTSTWETAHRIAKLLTKRRGVNVPMMTGLSEAVQHYYEYLLTQSK